MSFIENELTYLINPQYQHQIKSQHKSTNQSISKEELVFYRKRIIQTTRDLLDNIDSSSNIIIKESFSEYATSCISSYKTIDTRDIIQSEYNQLNIDNEDKIALDASNDDISDADASNVSDMNSIFFKQISNVNTIEDCMGVTKVKQVKQKEVFPNKKKVNLRDPSLKIKGVKKKSVSIITNEDSNEIAKKSAK